MDAGYMNSDETWTEYANSMGVNSYEDFLNTSSAQDDAIEKYHRKVWGYLQAYGATEYIGQNFDGVVITESGLLASAHLVGAGAVKNALDSGNVKTDAYGTEITEYLQFSGYDISYIK